MNIGVGGGEFGLKGVRMLWEVEVERKRDWMFKVIESVRKYEIIW